MRQTTKQEFSFSEMVAYPELVIDLLAEGNDIALLVRREGDKVRVYTHRIYNDDTNKILAEATTEYRKKKQAGYSREQAFHDFQVVQEEISSYL